MKVKVYKKGEYLSTHDNIYAAKVHYGWSGRIAKGSIEAIRKLKTIKIHGYEICLLNVKYVKSVKRSNKHTLKKITTQDLGQKIIELRQKDKTQILKTILVFDNNFILIRFWHGTLNSLSKNLGIPSGTIKAQVSKYPKQIKDFKSGKKKRVKRSNNYFVYLKDYVENPII